LVLTAHELGTPLHILLNAVAFVREGGVAAPVAAWLDAAERAVEWLARGVSQMHAAGGIHEQRRFPLHRQPVALQELLAEAVAALDLAACGRSLDIAVESAATVMADADPHWLRQAIDALLSNAVRFTPDGGRVSLAASLEGNWRRIEVTDTGIGIAPADVGTLFEPFSSAGGNLLLHGSGRLAFQARGLGLGLAMVKGIVEAHGGSVAVESAAGLGSRFTLRLPDGPA
jgi:two-component system sensor histidine kinase BaeS